MRIMKQAMLAATSLAMISLTTIGGVTPALAGEAKAPSPFVQCDGKVGHVSGGERFMRLLLVTATAGLSEAGMASDNATLRLKGAAGVAACDSALASEGDGYRRAELALARAIHLDEDKKWAEAATAAHGIPAYLPAISIDRSLAQSTAAASSYLEAIELARAGRYAEAEAAAAKSVEASRFEVVGVQRAARLFGLDRTMTPAKAAAFASVAQMTPGESLTVARYYAEGGDYRAAASLIGNMARSFDQFLDPVKREPNASMLAKQALYTALAGDASAARTLLAAARKQADADAASGDSAKYPSNAAEADEYCGATDVALALAEKRSADARRLFAARERWALLPGGVTAAMVGAIAPTVPEAERSGLLSKGEAGLWTETRDGRVKMLGGEKEARLWSASGLLQVDARYAGVASAVWTGRTAKPKLLIKEKADDRYTILSAAPKIYGIPAGEALMLHAALVAQARGKSGFLVFPLRKTVDLMAVRFVDAPEVGLGSPLYIPASDVVTALAERFPVAE